VFVYKYTNSTELPGPWFGTDLYFWSGCGSDQASTTGGSGAGTRHTLKSSRPPHFSSTSEQRFGMLPTHHHDAIPAGVAFQQYKATPPYGSVSSPTQSGSVPGTPFSQLGGQVFQIPLHHHRHSCQPLGEPAQMPVPYLSQELPSSSTKQRHHMDQCPRLLNLGLFQARHSVNWEGRFSRYHCTTTDTPVSLSENQHRCLSLTYHRLQVTLKATEILDSRNDFSLSIIAILEDFVHASIIMHVHMYMVKHFALYT
jgi:hypothetical protein